jgi:hypothetical protein
MFEFLGIIVVVLIVLFVLKSLARGIFQAGRIQGSDSNSQWVDKFNSLVEPQINEIMENRSNIRLDEVWLCYSLVACSFFKKGATLHDANDVLLNLAPNADVKKDLKINFNMALQNPNFMEMCSQIRPLVIRDIESVEGSYLVRYAKFADEQMKRLLTERVRSRDVDEDAWLKI